MKPHSEDKNMKMSAISVAVSCIFAQVAFSLAAPVVTNGFAGPKTAVSSAIPGGEGVLKWKVSGDIVSPLVKISKYVPEDEQSRVMFVKEGNSTTFVPAGLSQALMRRYSAKVDGDHVELVVQEVTEADAGVYRAELRTLGGVNVALVAFKVDSPKTPGEEVYKAEETPEEKPLTSGIGLIVVIAVVVIIAIVFLILFVLAARGVICGRAGRTDGDIEKAGTPMLPTKNGLGPPKTMSLPVRSDGATVDLDLFVCHEERPERVDVNQNKAMEVENQFGDGDKITKWTRFCHMDSEESTDTGAFKFTLNEFLEKSGLCADTNGSEQFRECVNRDPYLGKLLEVPVRSLMQSCAEVMYILVRSRDGSTAETTKLRWSLFWLQFVGNTSAEDFTPTEEIAEGFDLGYTVASKNKNVLMSIENEDRQNYFRYLALKRFYQDGLLTA